MTTTTELARKPPEGQLPTAPLDAQSRAQLFDLAMLGHEQGDHEGARDILHGLVVLNRADARAWALLGRVEYSLKELEGACDALSRALNLSRKDWDTALDLAEVHAALNEKKEAEALLTYVTLEAPELNRAQLLRLKKLGGRS
jgi:tetratricopeptide (TPR) repeat protein